MNREIEFRAWHKKQKRMFPVYGFNKEFVFEDSLDSYDSTVHDREDCELLQYTGLKDKKRTEEYPDGQKIFEGDTYKWYNTVDKDYEIGVIDFRDGCFMSGFYELRSMLPELEIIGNSPELLREEKNDGNN